MAKGPKGVTILFSLSEAINALNDSDRGKLLSAILDYAEHGATPKFNGELKIVFACVKPTIDNNISAYENRCQMNSQNAKKRWNINEKQGNATECERIQKMQTQANDAKVNKSKVNEMALNKLQELAPNDYPKQIQILDQSTMQCWRGLFALQEKLQNGGGGYGQASGTADKHMDSDRAALEKMSVNVV